MFAYNINSVLLWVWQYSILLLLTGAENLHNQVKTTTKSVFRKVNWSITADHFCEWHLIVWLSLFSKARSNSLSSKPCVHETLWSTSYFLLYAYWIWVQWSSKVLCHWFITLIMTQRRSSLFVSLQLLKCAALFTLDCLLALINQWSSSSARQIFKSSFTP